MRSGEWGCLMVLVDCVALIILGVVMDFGAVHPRDWPRADKWAAGSIIMGIFSFPVALLLIVALHVVGLSGPFVTFAGVEYGAAVRANPTESR